MIAKTLESVAARMFAAKSRPDKAGIGNSNAMMARYAPTVQIPDAWPGLRKNGYNAYGGNNVTNNDNSKSNATTIAMIALATRTAMRCWQDKRASKTSKRASKGGAPSSAGAAAATGKAQWHRRQHPNTPINITHI